MIASAVISKRSIRVSAMAMFFAGADSGRTPMRRAATGYSPAVALLAVKPAAGSGVAARGRGRRAPVDGGITPRFEEDGDAAHRASGRAAPGYAGDPLGDRRRRAQ